MRHGFGLQRTERLHCHKPLEGELAQNQAFRNDFGRCVQHAEPEPEITRASLSLASFAQCDCLDVDREGKETSRSFECNLNRHIKAEAEWTSSSLSPSKSTQH